MRRRDFLAAPVLIAAVQDAFGQAGLPPRRLAIVSPSYPPEAMTEKGSFYFRAVFEELGRSGYVEGRNLVVGRFSARESNRDLQAVVADVVRANPDCILAEGAGTARLLRSATGTLPIVAYTIDPVANGLADSLARPGGNVTGFTSDPGPEWDRKVIELLLDAAPGVTRIAHLLPHAAWTRLYAQRLEAFEQKGVVLLGGADGNLADDSDYRNFFAALSRRGAQGLVIADTSENISRTDLVVSLTREARLPAISSKRGYVERGGLMAYGANSLQAARGLGDYVARILKGARPADLPFQQPTQFDLAINLATARELGLTFSPLMLARANEVIE